MAIVDVRPEKAPVGQGTPKTIGLIGGLAFRAGVFYYEHLVERFAARNQVLRLVLNHADLAAVRVCLDAGDTAALGGYLGSLADGLFAGGADFVAVTAVAPHVAIGEVSRAARGPVLNILELIRPGIETSGAKRVAVFGNRLVIESNVYGAVPPAMAVPLSPALTGHIHDLYADIAASGKRGTHAEMEALDHAARGLVADGGADAILLAGTDLSSFYADQPPDYPSIDVARLHIDAIVRRALD